MGLYDDIMNLPHHVSATRAHMPRRDRAAQFSPFAALSGYDAAVRETARLTQERIELDESEKARLDEVLQIVRQRLPQRPKVVITYFKPDARKAGGAYQTVCGVVKKLDAPKRMVVMEDGSGIPIDEITEIDLPVS